MEFVRTELLMLYQLFILRWLLRQKYGYCHLSLERRDSIMTCSPGVPRNEAIGVGIEPVDRFRSMLVLHH